MIEFTGDRRRESRGNKFPRIVHHLSSNSVIRLSAKGVARRASGSVTETRLRRTPRADSLRSFSSRTSSLILHRVPSRRTVAVPGSRVSVEQRAAARRKRDTVCVVPDLIRDENGRRFRRELIDREGQTNSCAGIKGFPHGS